MQSLKNIWKRLQFEMAARDILEPPPSVMEIMKQDGWRFEVETHQPVMTRMAYTGPFTYISPYTPEGQSVLGGDEDVHKRYCHARREAAKQAFGMK